MRGLEFNAIAPNLLASGAEDGEIIIWDLVVPAEPSHFPPLKVCIDPDAWQKLIDSGNRCFKL